MEIPGRSDEGSGNALIDGDHFDVAEPDEAASPGDRKPDDADGSRSRILRIPAGADRDPLILGRQLGLASLAVDSYIKVRNLVQPKRQANTFESESIICVRRAPHPQRPHDQRLAAACVFVQHLLIPFRSLGSREFRRRP